MLQNSSMTRDKQEAIERDIEEVFSSSRSTNETLKHHFPLLVTASFISNVEKRRRWTRGEASGTRSASQRNSTGGYTSILQH